MNGNDQRFAQKEGRVTRVLPLIVVVTVAVAALIAVARYVTAPRPSRRFETRVFTEEAQTMDNKIHIVGSGPPLTIEQIAAFENEIGGRLPEDYKRFLLNHNGGCCEPDIAVPWAGETQIILAFSALYPDEYSGMRRFIDQLRDLNPTKADGYLPIASTTSECEICLKYRGKNAGAIYFTAYKYRKLEHPNEDLIPVDVTMVPLADSFSEFLDYVVVIPEIHCPIVDLAEHGTEDDLVRYLAEEHRSINALSKNGHTLLCEAIKYDNTAIINACIERGASLSGTVYIAVQNRRTHLIEMLVKAGADINERDECGVTPLSYVCGTALPGEEGARNRELRHLLLRLGAVK